MSRSLRAVKVEWGPHASLVMEPAGFENLVSAIIGDRITCEYDWNAADEVFRLWTEEGHRFLDLVRDCEVMSVVQRLDESIPQDATFCLENLKAVEPEWRRYVDKNGHLQIWVDAY